LLRILAGLLRPSGGSSRLALAGKEVAPGDRRTCIGFASPELAFYDELSVAENLRFAAESHGIDAPGRAVDRSLERVQLAASARDRAAALSSGMRQRLRLAFAVLLEPPVLLLDEPGSHLDATNDAKESALAEERIELRGRRLGDPA
jgi:ABC-type multidrug transport system ATPase subunit